MKTVTSILFATTIAFLSLGSSAVAADKDNSYVTFPNPVRCTACGAEYHVLAKMSKDNALQIKLEQINKTVNPKTR